MIFRETPLAGAYRIEPQRQADERGYFARTFCREEFRAHGLWGEFVQCNVSFNARKGTLRGMHYQAAPHEEIKLVRCVRGGVYDVIVDIRRESSTFGRWFAAELNEDNGTMLYIPKGFAHGFLSLTDDSEVFYQMSDFYHPESARGFRWDDPTVAIDWPDEVKVISAQDRRLPKWSV